MTTMVCKRWSVTLSARSEVVTTTDVSPNTSNARPIWALVRRLAEPVVTLFTGMRSVA